MVHFTLARSQRNDSGGGGGGGDGGGGGGASGADGGGVESSIWQTTTNAVGFAPIDPAPASGGPPLTASGDASYISRGTEEFR